LGEKGLRIPGGMEAWLNCRVPEFKLQYCKKKKKKKKRVPSIGNTKCKGQEGEHTWSFVFISKHAFAFHMWPYFTFI
jgi:hypothetical protein